jgi:hypothetical protein
MRRSILAAVFFSIVAAGAFGFFFGFRAADTLTAEVLANAGQYDKVIHFLESENDELIVQVRKCEANILDHSREKTSAGLNSLAEVSR